MAIIGKKDFGGNEVYIDDLVIHKNDSVEVPVQAPLRVKFKKLDDRAVVPSKRVEDAGYDIYGIPTQEEQERGAYCFRKGEVCMVPTGLATQIPPGYVAIVKERGSTGSKGLAIRCGVIDSGYRGEWFIAVESLIKDVNYPINKAIAQVIFTRAFDVDWIEEELDESDRGEGKLGSSGK